MSVGVVVILAVMSVAVAVVEVVVEVVVVVEEAEAGVVVTEALTGVVVDLQAVVVIVMGVMDHQAVAEVGVYLLVGGARMSVVPVRCYPDSLLPHISNSMNVYEFEYCLLESTAYFNATFFFPNDFYF